jgi:hypothetical protein
MRGTEGVEELGKKFLYPLKTLKKEREGCFLKKAPLRPRKNF